MTRSSYGKVDKKLEVKLEVKLTPSVRLIHKIRPKPSPASKIEERGIVLGKEDDRSEFGTDNQPTTPWLPGE